MKVLYDHQIFERQRYGGISRYFCELMRHLRSHENTEVALSARFSNNQHLRESGLYPGGPVGFVDYETFVTSMNFIGKNRLFRLSQALGVTRDGCAENVRLSRQALRTRDFDVFHPTYYDDYFLDELDDRPFVLTVYDMLHEFFPEMFCSSPENTAGLKKALIQKSAKIIAISENTKKDIVEFYGVATDKVQVIYLASPLNVNGGQHPAVPALPARYLLYVGERGQYKNFARFIRSMAPLLMDTKGLYVICAGGGRFTLPERRFLRDTAVADRVLLYHQIDDRRLTQLYQNALLFVYPSLYEGFGIPILEAFACGCPVVLSRASCFPEIAGDAAEYFDPRDEDSIRTAVARAMTDEDQRAELRRKGFLRLDRYSWERTARATRILYEGISSCGRADI